MGGLPAGEGGTRRPRAAPTSGAPGQSARRAARRAAKEGLATRAPLDASDRRARRKARAARADRRRGDGLRRDTPGPRRRCAGRRGGRREEARCARASRATEARVVLSAAPDAAAGREGGQSRAAGPPPRADRARGLGSRPRGPPPADARSVRRRADGSVASPPAAPRRVPSPLRRPLPTAAAVHRRVGTGAVPRPIPPGPVPSLALTRRPSDLTGPLPLHIPPPMVRPRVR